MNDLSSKCTLWNPLLLVHVTVSPALIVTAFGVNVLLGPLLCAVTFWLAAGADAAGRSSGRRMQIPKKWILERILMAPTLPHPGYFFSFTLRFAEALLPAASFAVTVILAVSRVCLRSARRNARRACRESFRPSFDVVRAASSVFTVCARKL